MECVEMHRKLHQTSVDWALCEGGHVLYVLVHGYNEDHEAAHCVPGRAVMQATALRGPRRQLQRHDRYNGSGPRPRRDSHPAVLLRLMLPLPGHGSNENLRVGLIIKRPGPRRLIHCAVHFKVQKSS